MYAKTWEEVDIDQIYICHHLQIDKIKNRNLNHLRTFSFKIVYCFHYYTTKCVIKIKTDIKIKIQIKIGDVKHISRIIAAEFKITTNTERMLKQTS
jgi:hypothetical protein